MTTSKYHLDRFYHNSKRFRQILNFLPLGHETPGAFAGKWFWTFSLVNIITLEVNGHN